jgi:hypothetical protein
MIYPHMKINADFNIYYHLSLNSIAHPHQVPIQQRCDQGISLTMQISM